MEGSAGAARVDLILRDFELIKLDQKRDIVQRLCDDLQVCDTCVASFNLAIELPGIKLRRCVLTNAVAAFQGAPTAKGGVFEKVSVRWDESMHESLSGAQPAGAGEVHIPRAVPQHALL
eukprot:6631037-Pyramimonas_sp.AAC.1